MYSESFLKYFYLDEVSDEVKGPHTIEELNDLEFSNVIFPETKVAEQGTENWVSLLNARTAHSSKVERLMEREAHEESMTPYTENTELLDRISFFELSSEKRTEIYDLISGLAAELENRALHKEEIQFLTAWDKLNDREYGERLLTQNEMSKSPEKQSTAKQVGVWGSILAGQGMLARNSLKAMETDVDDMADGLLGED